MKVFRTLGITALLLMCGTGAAFAQRPSGVGVSVGAGTLGFGIDLAVPVAQKVNIRGGFNIFGLSRDFDNDGTTVTAKLKLRSAVAQLDWFVFGGGFHLSPGVMIYNGNAVSGATSVANGESFSLGDSNEDLYSQPSNPVTGSVDVTFPKVAPMLTLGWGNLVPRGNRRWSIPFEIGVVYSGAPTAAFSLTGNACSNPQGTTNCRNLATDAGLQSDVAEEEDNINEDLKPLKIYPVISLGFSFKF